MATGLKYRLSFLSPSASLLTSLQTRYLPGFLFLLASCVTIIGILWFNPAFFCPIVMVIAGGVLIFLGMLIRSLAMFNSFM